MDRTLSISCDCGAIVGTLHNMTPTKGAHVMCYCSDCQAFAHFLEKDKDVLDARGGSAIFQTLPSRVTVERGTDHLAAVKVTPTGILRWHCRACRSPIGNTAPSPKIPFVGLLTTAISGSGKDETLGPLIGAVHQQDAGPGNDPLVAKASPLQLAKFIGRIIKGRLTGDAKHSPFFDASGTPISEPFVIDPDLRAEIDNKIVAGGRAN
ncbi:MAG: DUF6151 family protein [Pseudomonadota bacterium]